MSPVSIQTQAVIFYCLSGLDKVAGGSTAVHEFNNMVRGQNIYESVDSTH